MGKTRLRIRFTKAGDLRWISHRDLARLWERLLRRANLQLAFSQGFHPKPRISFPSALALGVEALDEIVELEVVGEVELERIEADIRGQMPPGMELLELASPSYSLGKAKVAGVSYQVRLPGECVDAAQQNIDRILSQPRYEVDRDGKSISCATDDPNFQLTLEPPILKFSIPAMSQGSIRPSEMLAALGLKDLLESGAVLQRTHVHLEEPSVQS